jgi:hypothetical protein
MIRIVFGHYNGGLQLLGRCEMLVKVSIDGQVLESRVATFSASVIRAYISLCDTLYYSRLDAIRCHVLIIRTALGRYISDSTILVQITNIITYGIKCWHNCMMFD